jgi:hypothetical protein
MRGSAFIAFFGLATAVSGSLIGCGDDAETPAAAKITKSGANESCTRTDDCAKGLSCVSNLCTDSGSGSGGTDSTGGTSGSGTTSPLGREGESCSRRADCQATLGCFNGRCQMDDTGEGGASPGTTVGGRGETCQLSSDCDDDLVCVPGGQNAPGVGFTGVCSQVDSGVTPTGKLCGAECREPADCCELPVEVHALLGTNVKSCTDLAAIVGGIDCDAANLAALPAAQCLANATYCSCSAAQVGRNWDCTEAGRCVYTGACTVSGFVPGGCPTLSRAGNPLTATCDIGESDRCQPTMGTPGCTTPASCDTTPVADDLTGDICASGECTCYNDRCLRRCGEDIDCRAGYECDIGTDVCVPMGFCTSDVTCKNRLRDSRATCDLDTGTCSVPCETDIDCNPGGLVNGNFAFVCAAGMCTPIGCTEDTECGGTVNGARLFCTVPAPGTAADLAQSAITD